MACSEVFLVGKCIYCTNVNQVCVYFRQKSQIAVSLEDTYFNKLCSTMNTFEKVYRHKKRIIQLSLLNFIISCSGKLRMCSIKIWTSSTTVY